MPAAAAVETAPPEPASKPPPSPHNRPPAYVDCYVCGRQFGSRSVAMHVPRCLEKWRAANNALPASERADEPRPPGKREEGEEQSLNSSWPRSTGRLREALEAQQSPRVSRPRTATLKKPRVLDAEKKTELDMSTTRCNELLQIVAQNREQRERPERAPSEERNGRPQTIKLTKPSSRDLNVPNIDYRPATVISPEATKAAKTTSKLGRRLPNFTRALEELFHAPRAKAGVPRPCMSCGKPENPERFHSHPAEPAAEPPRRAKRPSKKRMSIQRPVAIKYKPAAAPPQPPIVDPVAQRKQQLEEEQRLKQERMREEYLKKEEKSKKAREDAMRKKLAFTMAKQQRVANGVTAPPRPEPCYVCGKPFGANSLLIHQPQCLEKWRRDNESLPESQRQPEPQPPPPGESAVGASDDQPPSLPPTAPAPTQAVTQTVTEDDPMATEQQPELVPCRHCGRTFFPDRVRLHEKNCQPKDGDTTSREAPAQARPSQVAPPPSVCYICKARFPAEELDAHEVACVTRWREQNAIIAERMVPLPMPQQQLALPQPPQQLALPTSQQPLALTMPQQQQQQQQLSSQERPQPQQEQQERPQPQEQEQQAQLPPQQPERQKQQDEEQAQLTQQQERLPQLPRKLPQLPQQQQQQPLPQQQQPLSQQQQQPLPQQQQQQPLPQQQQVQVMPPQPQQRHLHRPDSKAGATLTLTNGAVTGAVAPLGPLGPVEQLEGQLDAMIDAAWQSHLSELVPCPNCGRTFFPDRLEKHTRNCKIDPKHK